jgi:type I restriction-modification system DNA methylase subunit
MAKQKVTTEEPLEKQLWKTADKLRKNIDAAEYKHIVLGLIFLKYISDAFEELYAKLKTDEANGADPEDKDEYKQKMFSLFRRMQDGIICNRKPNNLKLESLWTMQWMPLKKRTLP